MDPTGPEARRFPLVPRARPPCSPLPERVTRICELAHSAVQEHDADRAAAVFNQSALLASDCGLAELARDWCRRHAAIWLRAVPLDATNARYALEPLVNLARLQIREGTGNGAYKLLNGLYQAVNDRMDTTVDGIELPGSRLTRSPDDWSEVRRWIWAIHLAETPRALISLGRWHDALTHLEQHHGIGQRMLDGRQIAVIARCMTDDTEDALRLLRTTVAAERWEQVVTACLTVIFREEAGLPADAERSAMLDAYENLEVSSSLIVFRTRLCLTVMDAAGGTRHPRARHVATNLTRDLLSSPDGYAIRGILAHSGYSALLTGTQQVRLERFVERCGLGCCAIFSQVRDELQAALDACELVVAHRNSPLG
jgi:hypothetical protein